MNRLTENKIILIKRKTRLEELIARYNTVSQAKFYIEHLGADFTDYIREDENYKNAVIKAHAVLDTLGRVQMVDREHVPNFIFGKHDTIVAVGQDGLVANSLKYLTGQPLIGVNPDPLRWDGILLPFTVTDLHLIVQDVFNGRRQIKEITLAKASLNDGQCLYGINDLFIGQKTHVSARYQIYLEDKYESQSSSGIIISTGMGSTGWFKSVMAGASGIMRNVSNKEVGIKPDNKFGWSSDYLYYTVREPFQSKTTGTDLVFGKVSHNKTLKVVSQMPENGVIFSDGIESDFLQFSSGIEATISVAEKKGLLVV